MAYPRLLFAMAALTAAAQNAPAPKFSSKLAIYDLKSKTTRTIFEAKEVFEAPNWSPDGKFLLFNMGGKLYKIAPDGGKPEAVNLDFSLRCNNDHNLSPDGKLVAISCSTATSKGSQVYVAQADGSNVKMLAPTVPSYFHGWSPDGKFLAFVGQRNGVFNLFRVPVGGGAEERLTSKPPYDDGPDYSPDGKWIYFNSERSGKWEAWRMPADGAGADDAKAEQVTKDEFENWFPHPSPDGKHILVFSFPKGTKTHNERMAGVQLRMFATPGAKVKAVHPETLLTFFGGQGTINVNSWSPNSKSFAYVIFEPIK
jgi:Tol biopolymer transport system component